MPEVGLSEDQLREQKSFAELSLFDKKARQKGFGIIAGVDEAGRGPLAGPVVAAACILLVKRASFAGIDDSKKLSAEKRRYFFEKLTSDKQVIYGVGVASVEEIDSINIYQATIQAMLRAIAALTIKPDFLLVDGLKLPHPEIPSEKIIGGDGRSLSIAAASIIAKVTRDRLMLDYHQAYPNYGFDSHKGYGTPQHLAAIKAHGPIPIHRLTFSPFKTEE
ncbi:MAG: ribonuclease HII [Parachlamydiaceae bacterium]|nr:ribonuclease HII [Parachlamydiaceae bacterium]